MSATLSLSSSTYRPSLLAPHHRALSYPYPAVPVSGHPRAPQRPLGEKRRPAEGLYPVLGHSVGPVSHHDELRQSIASDRSRSQGTPADVPRWPVVAIILIETQEPRQEVVTNPAMSPRAFLVSFRTNFVERRQCEVQLPRMPPTFIDVSQAHILDDA